MAMAIRREEPAPMTPEQRPDLLGIRLRGLQGSQRGAREKIECSLAVRRRQRLQLRLHLEQKNEPMASSFVTVLGNHACQMQIRRADFQTQFLPRLAAGAGIRGLAGLRVQFPAAWAPE